MTFYPTHCRQCQRPIDTEAEIGKEVRPNEDTIWHYCLRCHENLARSLRNLFKKGGRNG